MNKITGTHEYHFTSNGSIYYVRLVTFKQLSRTYQNSTVELTCIINSSISVKGTLQHVLRILIPQSIKRCVTILMVQREQMQRTSKNCEDFLEWVIVIYAHQTVQYLELTRYMHCLNEIYTLFTVCISHEPLQYVIYPS